MAFYYTPGGVRIPEEQTWTMDGGATRYAPDGDSFVPVSAFAPEGTAYYGAGADERGNYTLASENPLVRGRPLYGEYGRMYGPVYQGGRDKSFTYNGKDYTYYNPDPVTATSGLVPLDKLNAHDAATRAKVEYLPGYGYAVETKYLPEPIDWGYGGQSGADFFKTALLGTAGLLAGGAGLDAFLNNAGPLSGLFNPAATGAGGAGAAGFPEIAGYGNELGALESLGAPLNTTAGLPTLTGVPNVPTGAPGGQGMPFPTEPPPPAQVPPAGPNPFNLGPQAASSAAQSALSRILNGTATADDWLKTLGTGGATLLGVLGSNSQKGAASDAFDKYWGAGAPFRDIATDWARTPANYFNSPFANELGRQSAQQINARSNVNDTTGRAALNQALSGQYLGALGAMGNLGSMGLASSVPFAQQQVASSGGIYNALGAGLNDLVNPKQDIAGEFWKMMKGGGFGGGITGP